MTITDNSSSGAGTIEEAASAFEQILSGSETQENAPKERADQAETEEVEAVSSEDEVEAASDADEAEDATTEEEGSEEEEETEDEEPSDELFTVVVNGEQKQVTKQELLNGYSATADYTRKTMALAEARKAFEAEVSAVRQEREQYGVMLSALSQQVTSEEQLLIHEMEQLRHTDPVAYMMRKDDLERLQVRKHAAQIEQQRLAEINAHQEQQHLQQLLQEEAVELSRDIPSWRNSEKRQKETQDLRQYLKSQRRPYTDEEISQAYDGRAIVMAYKAMKYDQLMSTKKPTPVPAKSAPTSRPSAASSPRAVTQVTRDKQRLAKTGRLSDAAKVFESLI